VLSMTGYGRGSAQLEEATLSVELRAVNARFLDVRLRLPPPLLDHAGPLDEVLRKRLLRGRVEATARLEGGVPGTLSLDRGRARAALMALKELRDEIDPSQPLPLSLLSLVPDLFTVHEGERSEAMGAALAAAGAAAADDLMAMRATEGAALEADLQARIASLGATVAKLEAHSGDLGDRARERLRSRLERLLQPSAISPDPARLEQELALLADRSDVSEELTRLASHLQQFGELLRAGAEPVGRRLEFLLQEMVREVNTTGSKISEVELTGCVLELKAELERIREQVQNIL